MYLLLSSTVFALRFDVEVKLNCLNSLWNWADLLIRLCAAVMAFHNSDAAPDVVLGLLVCGLFAFTGMLCSLHWRLQSAAFTAYLNIRLSYEGGQKIHAWRLEVSCVTKLVVPRVSRFAPSEILDTMGQVPH